jgi:hypothetical protein
MAGAFLQIALPLRTPSEQNLFRDAFEGVLHCDKFVALYPFHFQRQVKGNYLFIPWNPIQAGTSMSISITCPSFTVLPTGLDGPLSEFNSPGISQKRGPISH